MMKPLYSHVLKNLGEKLHFAAHSHHPWPDVSREAHLRYWDDSARYLDDKWDYFFSNLIPECAKKIAEILSLRNSQQIAFAPNTHELLIRLLSTFDSEKPIRILTTENEFHSFRRQVQRLEEAGRVIVTQMNADLLAKDRKAWIDSFKREITRGNFDLVFISQVFFDSGLALSETELLFLTESAPEQTRICIDGYHAFAALPVDLSQLEGRIFYLGGGYKYAQAGEGFCFMVVPRGNWRPLNTGWFAEMDTLSSSKDGSVNYLPDGRAFWGSTQDFSGFYRFLAVWNLFAAQGLSVKEIHHYVSKLQDFFLQKAEPSILSKYSLINRTPGERGHFLTYDLGSPRECEVVFQELKKKGVLTDYRGQRLRIGFGIYQDETDVLEFISRIRSRT